jgi:hypothetical protein
MAWSNDPAVNTAVCTAFDHQYNHQMVSDGSDGAIVTWQDYRDRYGTMSDIYAQRIDWKGKVLWALDGVVVSIAPNDQVTPQIVSDGSDGAVIMWTDSRNGNLDIYAQKIDASGNLLWQPDGVAICTTAHSQEYPQIISDGAGGAIITWGDARNGSAAIFAQRIDTSGNVLWATDGVAVSEPSPGHYPQIVSDGAGGAVISWSYGVYDGIHAQRIDSDGHLLWAEGGVVISADAAGPQGLRMAHDLNGGTIMVWQDDRNGYDTSDIYAQRIDAGGKVKWPSDVGVRIAVYRQEDPQITSDGAGGAIITWLDKGKGQVYAQNISGNGTLQWSAAGVAVSSATSYQQNSEIVSDGKGGAIITWEDYTGVYHIYAQRIGRDGKVMWLKDGVAISTATGNQIGPKLVRDGQGGAVIGFVNNIDGMTDLFVQKVSSKGQLQPVRVFSPNGGEVIASGSADETIEWGAPQETDSFKLLYSVDDGLTWETVDEGLQATSYTWSVPLQPGNKTKCRIKVIGYDASNMKVGSDISDAPFTIEVVRLTAPSDPEISIGSGDTYDIRWTTHVLIRPVETVALFYTKNATAIPVVWNRIDSFGVSDYPGTYPWKVPPLPSTKTKCKVKVMLKDGDGKTVGVDISDNFFKIEAPL